MRETLWGKLDFSMDKAEALQIENTETTTTITMLDAAYKKVNTKLLTDLGTDPYIIEASNILKDLIKLNSK